MKNLKLWLIILAAFLVVGIPLGILMGAFGFVIAALCAVLVAILLFRKKAEHENADRVVYDEDKNYYNHNI